MSTWWVYLLLISHLLSRQTGSLQPGSLLTTEAPPKLLSSVAPTVTCDRTHTTWLISHIGLQTLSFIFLCSHKYKQYKNVAEINIIKYYLVLTLLHFITTEEVQSNHENKIKQLKYLTLNNKIALWTWYFVFCVILFQITKHDKN